MNFLDKVRKETEKANPIEFEKQLKKVKEEILDQAKKGMRNYSLYPWAYREDFFEDIKRNLEEEGFELEPRKEYCTNLIYYIVRW